MKTFATRLIFCSSLLLADIASANASEKSVDLVGDVNGDGKITITDAVGIVDYLLGEHTLSFPLEVADVNGDEKITITDAVEIVSFLLGKEAEVSLDTIKIVYQNDKVNIDGSYDKNNLKVSVIGTKVKVVSSGKHPFVCLAEGESSNGALVIDADTTCTLTLNNLRLTSQESAAISFLKKQKVDIELPKGCQNSLSDASSRAKGDDTKACLYSKGTMTFTGKGSLSVSGNYSHAIASSKNISVEGGHLIIENVVKNGIHCDKFTLKKGQIDLHLLNNASKGIKAKEELIIKGGSIEGDASGGITIEDGDLSYCALLKCDSCMTVSDGTITLTHTGDGGRCISVDRNLTITGGTFTLECDGDGGQYINEDGKEDYYTPKCITADDSIFINSGAITCLSTGLGGKGVVAGKFLSIGNEQKDEKNSVPDIRVETKGTCIYDDIDEDKRFGCPKGIKAGDCMEIFNGNISVTTEGQGGEGLECKGCIKTYKATIICETYDDGINVGQNLSIKETNLYCHAINNDGIDSNGKITINSGVIVSISEHEQDESFDSETGRFYVYGGVILGIGNDWVKIRESAQPVYTTTIREAIDTSISLQSNKYLAIQDGKGTIISLYIPCENENVFLTCSSPLFKNNYTYQLVEADDVQNEDCEELGGIVRMGGEPIRYHVLKEIRPMIFNNSK